MMKTKFYHFFTMMMLIWVVIPVAANNIQVSNVILTGKNIADNYVMLQFDLSWENSWRTSSAPNNWDAAWVFVKYRIASAQGGDDQWKHALLHNTGHIAGAGTGSTIDPGLRSPELAHNAGTNPALGAFVYRSGDGIGPFSATGMQLRWNYGDNSVADDAIVEIKVIAVEMVYVPSGSFYLGSGGTESGSFTNGSWSSGNTIPFQITSENAITIDPSPGNLWGTSTSGESTIGGVGTLPAAYPKGFAAFYTMKYEISQQQYVDFLNTLTQAQANIRKFEKPVSNNNRYEITGTQVGSYTTANPYVACNFLSWMDGAAYADWAGLRPMTELEFEKVCRGTVAPVANEYAWGTTSIVAATGISNAGASNEMSFNSGANAVYGNSGTGGPLRVGAFATGSSTRSEAGASYYGIMELSGNVWERPVTVGNPEGRAFTGVHGDGAMSANGHANQTAWPGLSSGEVTGATGSGFRGAGWNFNASGLRASDRVVAVYTDNGGYGDYGFRGVRTISQAPGQPSAIQGSSDPYRGYTGISYSVTQMAGVTYTWSVPSGWSITAGQGTYEITVTIGTYGGDIVVTPENVYGSGPARTLAVTVVAPPCPGIPTVTDIDNNTYSTVQIGSQCWMQQNLKTTRFRDNTVITQISSESLWYANVANAAMCWYDYDKTTYDDTYGALYNWHSVNHLSGLCPTGWHVPSDVELVTLTNYLGGDLNAGAPLKDTILWSWPNFGATNLSGFSALPGGCCSLFGEFFNIQNNGYFWSSTEVGTNPNNAYIWTLLYNLTFMTSSESSKRAGYSVRCIKD